METFRNVFDTWLSKKVDIQISEIDKIAQKFDIDTRKWFNNFKSREWGDYSGSEFLNELLPNFGFYVSGLFEKTLLQYLPPKGENIYKEAYLGIHIQYELGYGFFVDKEDKKDFKKLFKQLTLNQKQELLKNKLFSYLIDKTNLKFLSKKEVRFLKLQAINGYSELSNK